MAFLDWSDDFSVNNNVIDTQHKKLIGLLNELFDAMSNGRGAQVLESVFTDLLKYTVEHFSAEESLMSLYDYPAFTGHKSEHDKLTRQVVEQYENYKAGNDTLSVPLLNFLKNWLANHILTVDRRFGEYLVSKGKE